MTGVEAGVQILREYADALRGAWGGIDGRNEKVTLNEIADVIASDAPPPPLETMRLRANLCPNGGGHWSEFCDSNFECVELMPPAIAEGPR